MNRIGDVEEFFKGVDLLSLMPDNDAQLQNKIGEREEDFLFHGDLSDINTWLTHEQFRLTRKKEDSERQLREKNAKNAFLFTTIWAGFIGIFILLHGFGGFFNFKIKNNEFLFVCGTLTGSILTFYLIVLRYLFPSGNDNQPKEKKA